MFIKKQLTVTKSFFIIHCVNVVASSLYLLRANRIFYISAVVFCYYTKQLYSKDILICFGKVLVDTETCRQLIQGATFFYWHNYTRNRNPQNVVMLIFRRSFISGCPGNSVSFKSNCLILETWIETSLLNLYSRSQIE